MVEFRVPILTRLGQDGPETHVASTSLPLIALESIEQGTICERENLQGSFLGVGGVRLSYQVSDGVMTFAMVEGSEVNDFLASRRHRVCGAEDLCRARCATAASVA